MSANNAPPPPRTSSMRLPVVVLPNHLSNKADASSKTLPSVTPTASPATALPLNALNPYSLDATGFVSASHQRMRRYDRLGPPPDPRADVYRDIQPRDPSNSQPVSALAQHLSTLQQRDGHSGHNGQNGLNGQSGQNDNIVGWMQSHPHLTLVPPHIQGLASMFAPIPDHASKRKILDEFQATLVRHIDGIQSTSLYDKIHSDPILSNQQKRRVVDVLAEVRYSFLTRRYDAGYNDVNWKHTCGEIGQVLDIAAKRGVAADATEDAVLASIFSDAAKFRENFLTHNVDGAIAAVYTLPRHGIGGSRLIGIAHATAEHQIGPPRFMAAMVRNAAENVIRTQFPMLDGQNHGQANQNALAIIHRAVQRIQQKIADPLNPQHVVLHPQGWACIGFDQTPLGDGGFLGQLSEQRIVRLIGLDAWYTMHPNTPWFTASTTVVDGDSLINYMTADGVGKIVAISGPNTPFRDEIVFDSIFSCGASYVDASSIMSDAAMSLAQLGVAATRAKLDAVRRHIAEQLQRGSLEFRTPHFAEIVAQERVDMAQLLIRYTTDVVIVEVPPHRENVVPFWNAPLQYDEQNAHFEFAKLIKRAVADALRI